MQGKLYLCATPIGNLDDITLRVLNTLKEVDLIAAEDTRHSIKLLNHFDIKTPMTSYHEFNKVEKARVLVEKMKEGTNIALITDAGTPGISDPGEELVKQCYEAGIELTSLPGPAACITALTISGMATRRFAFEAFLPSDKKEKQRILEELKSETRTIILYEAPHRLVRTLEELLEALGDRRITICRELTKKYETAFRTTFQGALDHFETEEPRGECVIVIEGKSPEEIKKEKEQTWEAMSIMEHMDVYLSQGIEKKEAMKLVAKMRPGKNVLPAGVFYYNISDPIVSATNESAEEIEDKIKGELRLKGMVNSDKDIAEKMDNTEGTSLNIPVSRKADGGFDSRRSKVMNTEQFNMLGRFVDVRAVDTADRIAGGDIRRSPYKDGQFSSCDRCPYGAVCGFSVDLPGCNYRKLKKFDDEVLWNNIKEGVDENGKKMDTGAEERD